MKRKNITVMIITLIAALIAVIIMFFIEQFVRPGYFLKSLAKVILFSGLILLYALFTKKKLLHVVNLKKPAKWKGTLILGIIGEIVILAIFLFLRQYIDLSGIRTSLMVKEGLTKVSAIFVLIYIITINSFLEESFFRGFLFHAMADEMPKIPAAIISSLLFAFYHIGIVSSWFNPAIFIACIVGLAAAGLLLQWLEEKNDSLLSSWMVHALANGAINSIGALIIILD